RPPRSLRPRGWEARRSSARARRWPASVLHQPVVKRAFATPGTRVLGALARERYRKLPDGSFSLPLLGRRSRTVSGKVSSGVADGLRGGLQPASRAVIRRSPALTSGRGRAGRPRWGHRSSDPAASQVAASAGRARSRAGASARPVDGRAAWGLWAGRCPLLWTA